MKARDRDEIEGLLNNATSWFTAAENSFESEDYNATAHNSSTSVQNLIKAVLIVEEPIEPDKVSRRGLQIKFNEVFLRSGRLEKSLNQQLMDLFELRNLANYSPEVISEKQARFALEQSEKFWDELTPIIGEQGFTDIKLPGS